MWWWTILVKVNFYNIFLNLAGTPHTEIELAPGASVKNALEILAAEFPRLGVYLGKYKQEPYWGVYLLVSVNGKTVTLDTILKDGDELTFLLPVGGG